MKLRIVEVILVLSVICVLSTNALADEKLMLFCDAVFRQPFEDVAQIFMKTSGIKLHANYTSTDALYSQIILLGRQWDLFAVPSPGQMKNAIAEGLIHPDSVKNFGYVAPAINVQKGNPKNIKGLRDLARPGIRIALGNPETVIGMLVEEIIEKGLSPEERSLLRRNLVTYLDDFPNRSSRLLLKQVDVLIGPHYLGEWYPDKVETVKLRAEEIYRIGAGQIAVLAHSGNAPSALKFIDFLLSGDGKNIFRKYHYFGTAEEAFAWVGGQKPVGGEYVIHRGWISK